ncbi:MAG: DUF3857 domain-containing protein [Bacteroidetes bacterium]|nr:DUF3857 domain-containing protein [Bacteroidota bacterium]
MTTLLYSSIKMVMFFDTNYYSNMRLYFLLAFPLLPLFSQAQNSPKKFGDVQMSDLEMKWYAKDSSASALILFNVAEVYLFDDFSLHYKCHVRIKFFDKQSIQEFAKHSIYLDRNDASISKLKGATYNLVNGEIEVSEMSKDAILKRRYDRFVNQIVFTLPNVKEGSIIEYQYVYKSYASGLPSWRFQDIIPTQFSNYSIEVAGRFRFTKDFQGLLPLNENSSEKDGGAESWTMRDVPAFVEEPFISNSEDYISKISFYRSGLSWSLIIGNLNNDLNFGKQIKDAKFLDQIAAKITGGITSDNERINAIVSYAKKEVKWNESVGIFPEHTFEKVLESKEGSSSEINLLITALLQKAGLKAFPMLISTRDHGKIRPTHSMREFNDVVCFVQQGEKYRLIDGTNRHLSAYALPIRSLNGEGLVIYDQEGEWMPIITSKSRSAVNATFNISESGGINGTLAITRDGLDALSVRTKISNSGENEYYKEFFSPFQWNSTDNRIENLSDPDKPLKESYTISGSEFGEQTDSLIYFNPILINKLTENSFKSNERKFPVDLVSTFENIYMTTITIPNGFKIESLPKSKGIVLPDNSGKFLYNISSTNNTIQLTTQFIVNKSRFTVNEYKLLKEMFDLILAKEEEQIVIRKK